jgi:hypothetical protein
MVLGLRIRLGLAPGQSGTILTQAGLTRTQIDAFLRDCVMH